MVCHLFFYLNYSTTISHMPKTLHFIVAHSTNVILCTGIMNLNTNIISKP